PWPRPATRRTSRPRPGRPARRRSGSQVGRKVGMSDMRSAVVVGAGIGGLAIAGALARTGWQVTLLERNDRLRGDSAALMIWPNGIRALHALGLGGGLGTIGTAAPSRGIRRPGGQWLVQPDQSQDEDEPDGAMVVHREDLHDTLVAGLGDRIDI